MRHCSKDQDKQLVDSWNIFQCTRENFCLLCEKKKKKTVNECDECDRRVSSWSNCVRPYQTSKKPRQKIGELLGLADFLWGDFIALFCLLSVTKYIAPSNKRTGMQTDKVLQCNKHGQRKFLSLSVPKFRFSAVSRSSWRWTVHVITDRWTGTWREFI